MHQIKFGALTVMGAIVLFACSAPATSQLGDSEGNLKDDSDSEPTKPSSSSTSSGAPSVAAPTSSATAAGPAPAGTAPTAGDDDDDDAPSACEQQCIAKFPNGQKQSEAAEQQWAACACAPTACAAQCGQTEMCKEDGTAVADGDACAQCLEGAGAKCDVQFDAACTGECASFSSCVETCEGGGEGEGGEEEDD